MADNCRCVRCLDYGWKATDQARGYECIRPSRRQMVVCQTCGNKRCPHANDHNYACTNSNEPNQPGSLYGPDITGVVGSPTGERT